MFKWLLNLISNFFAIGGDLSIILILGLIFIVGLWSSLSHSRLSYLISGPAATKLFLSVKVGREKSRLLSGEAPIFDAHVIDISTTHVMFVAPVFVAKGEELSMRFIQVLEFDPSMEPYRLSVSSCRRLKEMPGVYLVKSRFERMAPAIKVPLREFIDHQLRRQKLGVVH
jgi:hypothetical protein